MLVNMRNGWVIPPHVGPVGHYLINNKFRRSWRPVAILLGLVYQLSQYFIFLFPYRNETIPHLYKAQVTAMFYNLVFSSILYFHPAKYDCVWILKWEWYFCGIVNILMHRFVIYPEITFITGKLSALYRFRMCELCEIVDINTSKGF